ncbi:MAG: DUF58 domain-containing protein [Thermoleophilia bacterium]|jgi:uncharacterized protein (DUF58 family)
MPTRKTIFWFTAAIVLYLIAWNIGSGWLYILVAMLTGFPLTSILLTRLNTRGIKITQESAGTVSQGDSVSSRLTINNSSIFPRFFLRFKCYFGGAGNSALLPFLGGRRQGDLSLEFKDLRRGVYAGGLVSAESSAPIGLALSRRRFDTQSPLVVYPRWHGIRSDWGEGRKDAGYMVSSSIPTRHATSDFLGVREYRPEDSPRSIHWRTSARSNKLAVIEYARQSAVTPVFIVDAFIEGISGTGQDSSFETAVSLAASLVQREARKNRRFAIGETLIDAAERGLEHDPGPAMLWLSNVSAGASGPLELPDTALPWPESTPVLIMTSHTAYSDLHRNEFFQAFPGSIIVMLDGRGFDTGKRHASRFMDEEQLRDLADGLESLGSLFLLVPSPESVPECLENL